MMRLHISSMAAEVMALQDRLTSHSLLLLLLVLGNIIALCLPRISGSSTPLNVDSIDGRRVHFSKADTREISEDIIGVLDLEHIIPRQDHFHRFRRRRDERASVPTFMRDVYDELEAVESDQPAGYRLSDVSQSAAWRSRFNSPLKMRYNVSSWIENSLFAADLIVSVPQDETFKATSWEDRQRRMVFRFDHLQTHNRLAVLGSELRIFRHEFAYAGENMQLVLHRMRIKNNEPPVIVETLVTDLVPGQTGWIEVNITNFVRQWMDKPVENGGIYLRLLNARGSDLPPDLLGFETRANQPFSPFVVASYRSGAELSHKRLKRSADRYRRKHQQKKRRTSYRHRFSQNVHQRTCARHTLEVDFKDLKWDDWVIAPRVYNAFYCAGECSFPLNTRWNITNHSIVQTLLRYSSSQNRRHRVPNSCCVPIELKSMKMLYFDRESRVVLRTYENMVVESCGCH